MAKPHRKQKLKVYRTPIGFHDAYVAAPSQKAALEAWGAETNLFGRGIAEQVSDPKLMKVPLEHPGQVVKVLRGTEAEQIAALEKQMLPKRSKADDVEILPKRAKRRPPRPSRASLDQAEEALKKVEDRNREQLAKLDRERREMQRRHERERDKAQEAVEREQEKYEIAMRRYESR
jgi:hypothetical protein